jgi:periplasmic copper chaperone A
MKIYNSLLTFILLIILSSSSYGTEFSISTQNNLISKLRPGQKVTTGYLNIVANKDAKIIMIKSKMIGRIETHSMIMNGEVMKMRKITPELKKNINYEFKSGGNHLMLFDIKRELKANDNINLLFTFELKNKEILSKSILFKVK